MNSNSPRAYTPDEVRHQLLAHFKVLVNYWANETRVSTEVERMEGLVHSILATLDGATLDLPAMDLIPAPHESDKAYLIDNDENWYEKTVINDCQLHEIWGQKYRQSTSK